MSGVVPFSFEGAAVRVLDRDGEPWFVLADVCRVLEVGNPSMAASRLDDDEKDTLNNAEGIADSRVQALTIINESGLYSLILTSRKEAAKRFKKWVTAEVLPSIRKTGAYGNPDRLLVQTLNDPVAMRGLLLTYTEKVLALQDQVADLAPKADALERIATAQGSLCITDAAKALQIRPKDLFDYLRQHGWIYRRAGTAHDVGYQSKVTAGLLEHKVVTILRPDGSEVVREQVRVTPKGLARLAMLIQPAVKEVV